MIDLDQIVLFGPPGVGKTTLARELSEYGYYYYAGDNDLFPESVELNSNGNPLTEDLRERQNEFIIQHIVQLSRKHPKLVVDYDFMWDRHRRRLMELCPSLRWIFLDLDRNTLQKRVDRPGHILSVETAMRIFDKFEKATIPYVRVVNSGTYEDAIKQIIRIG